MQKKINIHNNVIAKRRYKMYKAGKKIGYMHRLSLLDLVSV